MHHCRLRYGCYLLPFLCLSATSCSNFPSTTSYSLFLSPLTSSSFRRVGRYPRVHLPTTKYVMLIKTSSTQIVSIIRNHALSTRRRFRFRSWGHFRSRLAFVLQNRTRMFSLLHHMFFHLIVRDNLKYSSILCKNV